MDQLSPILRAEAGDRLTWWCPGCNGSHAVKTGVNGWTWNGAIDSPTFTPSVLVTYDGSDAGQAKSPPAVCHSFVTDGQMQFLDDCTHALAGQTVPIPPWPRQEWRD